ncbi:MAG TPA: polysaccharide biosynthesis/export family protein [Pirellulaceae bacterium]|nr:polysaccharide biosynthesis/export family protein [Pirellulaceae bacterium]
MSTQAPRNRTQQLRLHLGLLALVIGCVGSSGCTAILSPIDTIPAHRVPPQFLKEPEATKVQIDMSRLRQPKPEHYLLDSGDVLAIFVEGIIGGIDETPPVSQPPPDSDLPPAIGYPFPVREDGTVSLPLVKPISVRGLTLQQAEQLIARTFLEGEKPIISGERRIIVTLLRKRTYRVFVVRSDNLFYSTSGQFAAARGMRPVTDRSDESARAVVLQLPAYQNDLLNALAQTGGLPGINAKAEIRVMRGDRLANEQRAAEMKEFYRTHGPDEFPYGILPTIPDESNSIRIPLRFKPDQPPSFRTEDILLREGDIVFVDNRDTEVYYTGGLLGGGEFPLPRDYDLDVLGALSIAGAGVGFGRSVGGGAFAALATVPPNELIVLRRIPGNRQLAIRVDLVQAINDPKTRILVKPGDTLILRYKPQEELVNFGIGTFFTFGLRNLFRR